MANPTEQQRVSSNAHASTSSFAYCALPLRIPERHNTLAHIYIKPFTAADTTAPEEGVAITGQTLFFTGLPLGMDQQTTRALFQQFGTVTNVVLHHNKVRTIAGASGWEKHTSTGTRSRRV